MWLWGSQPEETHQIIVQSYPLIQTREKQSYSTVERAIFLYIFLLRNQAFCHFFKVVLTLDLQVISSRICKGLSAVFGCGVFLFLSVWSRHRLKIIRFCLKWTEDSHEKWVKNLSDRNLIEPEKKALAKGLHFAISPQQLPTVDLITATKTTIHPSSPCGEHTPLHQKLHWLYQQVPETSSGSGLNQNVLWCGFTLHLHTWGSGDRQKTTTARQFLRKENQLYPR